MHGGLDVSAHGVRIGLCSDIFAIDKNRTRLVARDTPIKGHHHVMPLAWLQWLWSDDFVSRLIPRIDHVIGRPTILQIQIPAPVRFGWIHPCDHRSSRRTLNTNEAAVRNLILAREAPDIAKIHRLIADHRSLAERRVDARIHRRPFTRLPINDSPQRAIRFIQRKMNGESGVDVAGWLDRRSG